jgi:hypothetical protein
MNKKKTSSHAHTITSHTTQFHLEQWPQAIVPPYFMNEKNMWSLQDSPEFWFSTKGGVNPPISTILPDCSVPFVLYSGVPGAGAKAHMDEHCTTTMSVQLDGEKRWRLGWMPPPKPGVRSIQSVYSDGAVYSMGKGQEED